MLSFWSVLTLFWSQPCVQKMTGDRRMKQAVNVVDDEVMLMAKILFNVRLFSF